MNNAQFQKQLSTLLDRALAEDLGKAGDITSNALFSRKERAGAVIRSKEAGVLSGAYLLAPLYAKIDPSLSVSVLLADGAVLAPGADICRLNGSVRSILAGERVALNFLQRLSGIATLTARYAAAIRHTKAKLLDTRKTTPGLRPLEKLAVRHGGGENHRAGLFDMVLIKGTHVKRCGGVTAALKKAMASRGKAQEPKIEIEVQNAAEFEEALALRPDRIMLDNMSAEGMRGCVEKMLACGMRVELEASGNISPDNAAEVAETGVDFISCGAITHSAKALDIHLIMT
ncbi:MAG: carboxylating nicotinate-nucleotide diphosphorylase [Chitinispirillaceae bacterium]|nr:carboxylating nicotinate-nucleotide diphosphorylase [Chitinispirillaceae bacterium]